MQELLTLSEAADRLGINVTTLRTWVRGGRVPAYRLGQRFTRVDWTALLESIAVERDAHSQRLEQVPRLRGGIDRSASPNVGRRRGEVVTLLDGPRHLTGREEKDHGC